MQNTKCTTSVHKKKKKMYYKFYYIKSKGVNIVLGAVLI